MAKRKAMSKQTLIINPVTRIEGHGKITIQLDEQGKVADARFHVTQFRGFEKLCEGRPFYEMPSLMARICGICPVSHLVASAKACDAILADAHSPHRRQAAHHPESGADCAIPRAELLSSFLPGFAAGYGFRPGAAESFLEWRKPIPQMARDGVRLRQIGQQIIEKMAGKRIHPAWVVAGGVNEPLSVATRDQILAVLPEALEIATTDPRLVQERSRSVPRGNPDLRQFPHLLPGTGESDRGA